MRDCRGPWAECDDAIKGAIIAIIRLLGVVSADGTGKIDFLNEGHREKIS